MGGNNFGIADFAVLAIMLVISSGIGLYVRFSGGRQRTASEFLFANGEMGCVPVAFSIMASYISAVSLLGISAENYSYGTQFMAINVGYGLVTPIVVYLFLPVYFNAGVSSAYEYLERRFGKRTRFFCSFIYCIQMTLYMAIALYAPALALEAVTGMPKLHAVLMVGSICTFYSTIGGLKAVIFTDVFQSFLMYGAVFSIIIVAWIDKGSLSEIWRIASAHGRIELDNFSMDPTVRHSWWSLVIGGGVTYISVYAVNQGQIQRYMSAGNLKTAQKSVWLNWPIVSLLSLSTSFAGLAIFSKYARCDPFITCKISQSDQLMPFYVVDTMHHVPGLCGLFVSGIFSAALSTVSATINSLAAVTFDDFFKPVYKKVKGKEFPGEGSICAKVISLIYGGACIILASMADQMGGVLQAALTVLGVVGGPTLGLFSLGMFSPHVHEIGALCGFSLSLTFTFWLGFSSKPAPTRLPAFYDGCDTNSGANYTALLNYCSSNLKPDRSSEYFYLFRISYLWLAVLGLISCVLIGLLVSFIQNAFCSKSRQPYDSCMFVPPIAFLLRKNEGHTNNNNSKGEGEELQIRKIASNEELRPWLSKHDQGIPD